MTDVEGTLTLNPSAPSFRAICRRWPGTSTTSNSKPQPLEHLHLEKVRENTPARFQACDDICLVVKLVDMGMHAGWLGGCDSWD